MKTQTKIKAIMKSYGFELHRSKNHLIWRDNEGNQIVTGKSISDHRGVSNIIKTLEKAKKNCAS